MNFSNPTFVKWFKSIMLVVGCILLLCSILCGYMLLTLRNTTLQMSSDFTQYIQKNMDTRLLEIQKYASVLELHSTNSSLKKLTVPPEHTSTAAYQFSDQMLNYKSANALVDGIFIYYPEINQIVGDLGCYPENSYYALDNMLLLNGYDEWLANITVPSTNGFVFMEIEGSEKFCYIRRMNYDSKLVGYTVFELNTAELLRATIPSENIASEYFSFGILINNQLFAYTGNGELLMQLTDSIPTPLETPAVFEDFGSLLYARPSAFTGLCYLNAYVNKKNLQPIYATLGFCIVGVVLCAVFGIISSIYISRKNIKPLIRLMAKIGDTSCQSEDEYQIISERIDQLMHEKFESVSKMQDQQSLINSLFLKMVLCGDMHSEYAIFNVAKRCDVVFENPCYLIALFHVTTHDHPFVDSLLSQINGYCESQKYDVISAFYEENIVVLFNLEENISQTQLLPFLTQIKSELLHENLKLISLGQSYDGLLNIHTSYTQAIAALHFEGKKCSDSIVCYSSTMESLSCQKLPCVNIFENFSIACFENNYDSALLLIPSLFDQYFCKDDSSEMNRIKFRAIQNLLLDTRHKTKQHKTLLNTTFNTAQILSCSSPAQLREYTEILFQSLCQKEDAPAGTISGIAERAKTIIQRDFADSMLGLYLISAELKVSDSYLSTTFKSHFGIGVVQYINSLRIEQAKKLICSTDLSIREIALAVGFSSDASFIRVFKRHEMQTPNTLRKSQK